jgi:hypothetical protein
MLARHALPAAVLLAALSLSGCAPMPGNSSATLPPAVAQALKACNIVWDSPSKDSFESMPLPGVRGAGANVWAQDGSLWIYLAHNGAYDESGASLKLGALRVTPVGVDWNQPAAFKQTQDLATDTITIESTASSSSALSRALDPGRLSPSLACFAPTCSRLLPVPAVVTLRASALPAGSGWPH